MLPWFLRAREYGYRCVVCGTDGSRQMAREADAYYQMPYSDRQGCIAVAEREKVDGVMGGGDMPALTAAYVAKALSLPGNNPEGMERLINKQEFRKLQRELGLPAPDFIYASDSESFLEQISGMTFPIIVKPGQMSSSRGVRVFRTFDRDALTKQFDYCKGISNNNFVCAETYLSLPGRMSLEFNPILCGDRAIWAGDMTNIHSAFNPEVPSGTSWPMDIDAGRKEKAHSDIMRIIKASGMGLGEMDIESVFTENGDFIILEVNPRRCGGGLQEPILHASGIDHIGIQVALAVGDRSVFDEAYKKPEQIEPVSAVFVFSHKECVFNGIEISEELKPYLIRTSLFKPEGSIVGPCGNFRDAVGRLLFHFPSAEVQKRFFCNNEEYINVI